MRRRRTRPTGVSAAIAAAASLEAVQQVINAAPEAWGRKHIIMACREASAISDEAAILLLQAYQLETA